MNCNSIAYFLDIVNIYSFPPNVTEDLIKISDWLITHNEDDFMNVRITLEAFLVSISSTGTCFQVYARFRANAVQKTLQALRDHLRNSNAIGLQANSPVGPSSGISPSTVRY